MPKSGESSGSSGGAGSGSAQTPTTSKASTTADETSAAKAAAAAAVAAKYADLDTKRDSSWPMVLFYIHLNILGVYGLAVLFSNTFFTTFLFTAVLTLCGIVGMTCGAHRLWAHRSYEANAFLRGALMLCQTMAGQVSKSAKAGIFFSIFCR